MKNRLILLCVLGTVTYMAAQALPDVLEIQGASQEVVVVMKITTGVFNFGAWWLVGLAFADEYLRK